MASMDLTADTVDLSNDTPPPGRREGRRRPHSPSERARGTAPESHTPVRIFDAFRVGNRRGRPQVLRRYLMPSVGWRGPPETMGEARLVGMSP